MWCAGKFKYQGTRDSVPAPWLMRSSVVFSGVPAMSSCRLRWPPDAARLAGHLVQERRRASKILFESQYISLTMINAYKPTVVWLNGFQLLANPARDVSLCTPEATTGMVQWAGTKSRTVHKYCTNLRYQILQWL